MLLSAEHITRSLGARVLLEDVNLYLDRGEKLGDHRGQRGGKVHPAAHPGRGGGAGGRLCAARPRGPAGISAPGPGL